MHCNHSDCFYCAKGACVSLRVLSVDKCSHFLHKDPAKRHATAPNVRQLAALRAKLETDAPLIAPRAA